MLLYDDSGNPVNVGAAPGGPDPNRRILTTSEGSQAFHSFPILYFEPNSRIVADPTATPVPIHVTPIVDAAPLRPKKRP